jgi:hypothetical protein
VNSRSRDAKLGRLALAIWDNDDGAGACASSDHDYGRRVEADRSWTVYPVFSGVPASIADVMMTGLSRLDASAKMLSLNHRNVLHTKKRKALLRAPAPQADVASAL